MGKGDAIPQDVRAVADDIRTRVFNAMHDDDGRLTDNDPSEIIARAILAEREKVEAAREFVKRHPSLSLIDLAEFEAFIALPAAIRKGSD